jgi:heme a synthase
METSLPRTRGFAVSARAFRRLTLVNAVMLVVIVATGATVRLTASGLGCEHWPGCEAGHPLPEKGYHSYVEFSNRIVAAVTILVTLATLVAAFAARAPVRQRRLAAGTFAGTLAQAPLGAITVYYHLNPWLVLTHFLLSLVVLTLGVLLALEAWHARGVGGPRWTRPASLAVAAAAGVLVVTGTLVTAAGPHPGTASGGAGVRRVWSFEPAVWLHVRAAAAFAIAFVGALVWLWRRRSPHARVGLVVLGVLAVQMAVGEIQYRTKLPWWLVLGHVTLAASVWAATVAFVAGFWRPSRMS